MAALITRCSRGRRLRVSQLSVVSHLQRLSGFTCKHTTFSGDNMDTSTSMRNISEIHTRPGTAIPVLWSCQFYCPTFSPNHSSSRQLHSLSRWPKSQLSVFKHLKMIHLSPVSQFSENDKAWSKTDVSELLFEDNDLCLLFDEKNALITRSTVAKARAIATQQKLSLTFLNKNTDGELCFKLQSAATDASEKQKLNVKVRNKGQFDFKQKAKQEKVYAKEFNIKSNTDDHDLGIKLNKMKTHITKGKSLVVFLKPANRRGIVKDHSLAVADFKKRLCAEFDEMCKVHQDYSNEAVTRFTITPNVIPENKKTEEEK